MQRLTPRLINAITILIIERVQSRSFITTTHDSSSSTLRKACCPVLLKSCISQYQGALHQSADLHHGKGAPHVSAVLAISSTLEVEPLRNFRCCLQAKDTAKGKAKATDNDKTVPRPGTKH